MVKTIKYRLRKANSVLVQEKEKKNLILIECFKNYRKFEREINAWMEGRDKMSEENKEFPGKDEFDEHRKHWETKCLCR